MTAGTLQLDARAYGKRELRVLSVSPGTTGDDVAEATVAIAVQGGLDECYADGDNRRVVTTDALAGAAVDTIDETGVLVVEEAALAIATKLRRRYPFLPGVEVEIDCSPWRRLDPAGGAPVTAFAADGRERHSARVSMSDGAVRVVSGWSPPPLLRTRGHRFVGFVQDEWTTNHPAPDRPVAGELVARWDAGDGRPDWGAVRDGVRSALGASFRTAGSESVQHLLTVLCRDVLDDVPAVQALTLELDSIVLVGPHRRSPTGGDRCTYAVGGSPRGTTRVSMVRDRGAGPGDNEESGEHRA